MLKNFKELKVWQKSYELCLDLYKITNEFPEMEKYGLIAQIRRASIFIPSNIAEGYGRDSLKEYIHFLYNAYGSICELETQILISFDLRYIKKEKFDIILESIKEVERMLMALIRSLKKKILETSKP